jgi:catechol 2,3-dioxygenase-like lactoylglutathione lyase family enzyme
MVRASFRTGTSGIVVVVFDHVTIRVADRGASERFYDTVLRTLGIGRDATGDAFTEWGGQFSLAAADAEHPVTRGLHIARAAPSREHVHAFWQAGVDAGFRLGADTPERVQFRGDVGSFSLIADGGRRTEHLHLASAARDDAAVDAFHAAATAAGHRDNGLPGERTSYHRGYYSAYALDPDGANIELVNHNR